MIAAEGLTEVTFIRDILRPHFDALNIWIEDAHDIWGGITLARMEKEIKPLLEDHRNDYVTTLVDYYGFKDVQPGQDVADLEELLSEKLQNSAKFIPYVQLHEFEALLFTNPAHIVDIVCNTERRKNQFLPALSSIKAQFPHPEAINNSPETAPSKRVESIFGRRSYNKVFHGPRIAESIGLPEIRKACPRFNQWLTRLEALGNPNAC